MLVIYPFTRSVTSWWCYWSHLKASFQLPYTPGNDQTNNVCSSRSAVISTDRHTVLHKLLCPAAWADFTEWHHVVSKILSVQKVYCNTLWCFIIGGQFDLVNKSNQIQEQIKKKKKIGFIFHFLILYFILSCPIKWNHIQIIIYYITVAVTTNGKSVVTETLPGCHWTFSYFDHSFEYNNEFHHS